MVSWLCCNGEKTETKPDNSTETLYCCCGMVSTEPLFSGNCFQVVSYRHISPQHNCPAFQAGIKKSCEAVASLKWYKLILKNIPELPSLFSSIVLPAQWFPARRAGWYLGSLFNPPLLPHGSVSPLFHSRSMFNHSAPSSLQNWRPRCLIRPSIPCFTSQAPRSVLLEV